MTTGSASSATKKATVSARTARISFVKGSLVACYFMHLISEKKLIYAVLVITVVKFVALLFLPVLTHSGGYWIH